MVLNKPGNGILTEHCNAKDKKLYISKHHTPVREMIWQFLKLYHVYTRFEQKSEYLVGNGGQVSRIREGNYK